MINNPSLGYAPIDPNTQRALVELASVISDVESRIQAVKFGLAQTFPHLAPQLASRTSPFGVPSIGAPFSPAFGSPYGTPGPIGAPFAAPWPTTSPYGVPTQMGTPYGVPPTMGVSPFLPTLPFGSFRP